MDGPAHLDVINVVCLCVVRSETAMLLPPHLSRRLCRAVADGVGSIWRWQWQQQQHTIGGGEGCRTAQWRSVASALTAMLGESAVVQDAHGLEKYNADWLGKVRLVLRAWEKHEGRPDGNRWMDV